MNPYERIALCAELLNCEYRAEQLKARLGQSAAERSDQMGQPVEEEVPAHMVIPDEARPRAEARLAALEARCQEILQALWPIDEGLL
jgi:hypothetical protein